MGFKRTAPGDKSHQGPDAALAHRSLDIPCQVASPQSLTPFLQADPVYPRRQTIGKYHWTPDLCLENPRAKPGAFLSRMNHSCHPERSEGSCGPRFFASLRMTI